MLSPSELALQLAADRAGVPHLRYRDGRGVLRHLPLDGDALTVGREPGVDLVLAWDPEVSRVHARLERPWLRRDGWPDRPCGG